MFIDAVARNRGVTTKKVLAMADGRLFIGEQAQQGGLIDAVGTLEGGLAQVNEIIDVEAKTETKRAKGVKAKMNKNELKTKYPDDYEAIAEVFAGDVTDLEQEKATLIREKKSLEDKLEAEQGEKSELLTKLAKADQRLDALEAESDKRKTLDHEGKMKTEADAIWKEKLDKSEIPERLHDKAMDQVKFGQFIKGKDDKQALDVEAFTTAVEAEIADSAWNVEEASVLGTGANADRSVDGEGEKLSAEDDKIVNRIYKKSGGKD